MNSQTMTVSDRGAELVALALLVVAVAFGGGSRGAGDLVVHLTAVAALPVALLRARHAPLLGVQRWVQVWFVAAAAVLALQLLPLPPGLWAQLPMRAPLAQDLASVGAEVGWRPLSLEPWGTVRALLWLLTGYASWRLLASLPPAARVRWVQVAVLLGVAMALLGFAQASAGRHPTVRFHPFHNEFGASGTFANRNHFALLMAMLAPLALGLGRVAQARWQATAYLWYLAAVVLVLAAALSFSRAGFLLACGGSAIAAVWAWRWQPPGTGAHRHLGRRLALAGTAALAVVGVATYAWTQLAARLEKDPLDDLRFQYLEHGLSALKAYLPWGSGAGSFRWVYAPFEPEGAMSNTYALHAHNDLIEVVLELGVPGLLLAGIALVLLAWTVWQARAHAPRIALPVFVIGVAIVMPLLHSLVDYPLRTLSLVVVFTGLVAQLGWEKISTPRNANPLA